MVHGTVDGDANTPIIGYSNIEEGTEGSLTFLANKKYTHHIYTTKASVVIVQDSFVAEHPINATLVRVADPYATVGLLLNYMSQFLIPQKSGIEQPSFVHESATIGSNPYIGAFAYIAPGAKIGNNVKIYPQAYIGDNVVIGDNTIIYAGAKIYYGCVIGANCVIHAGAVIGSDGFGHAPNPDGTYSKIAQIGIVEIEDNVEVGANTTIDRATMSKTIIRKGVKLDNLIQIAHNVEVGENTVMAAQVGVAGSTKIGKNNMFGGQVGVAGHITVGDNNGFGAQCGVPNSVGSNNRLLGTPAINALEFARHCSYINRLGQMYSDLKDIKKQLENK